MIDLFLHTKNGALISDHTLESDFVPRAGEILDLSDMPRDIEIKTFFVTEVIYKFVSGRLVPQVSCKQWLDGDREDELRSLGWLMD